MTFFRLCLNERDYDGALRMVDEIRRGASAPGEGREEAARSGKPDKSQASYLAALVYLRRGEPARALPEIEVLRQSQRDRKNDRKLELELLEAQGLYLCATGAGAAGLKLLQKAVEKTKNDYGHHSWGNGAYFMEAWGVGALQANKLDVAEEAFQEALAHDPGQRHGGAGDAGGVRAAGPLRGGRPLRRPGPPLLGQGRRGIPRDRTRGVARREGDAPPTRRGRWEETNRVGGRAGSVSDGWIAESVAHASGSSAEITCPG